MDAINNMDARARQIMADNDLGRYTVPTRGLYPYVWNWDSAFAALGFATYDMERAWVELDTLFAAQWPDGMVPHILFEVDDPDYFPGPSVWQANKGPVPSSGITQPPVAATVIRELAARDPARAYGFVDALNRWHTWFHAARDPDGVGVIGIVHPWESGRDNLPDWDLPASRIDTSGVGDYTRRDTSHVNNDHRPRKEQYDRYLALVQFGVDRDWDQVRIARECPFFVADPAMTAIVLRAERDLKALAQSAGITLTDIDDRIARLEAGMDTLWRDDIHAYVAKDLRTGELADSVTSGSYLALYGGVTKYKDALIASFDAVADACTYTVPSFDPRDHRFDHVRYWSGPVWSIVNWMIGRGFEEQGATAQADRIRRDTAAVTRIGNFHEYFSPTDGQGCGGKAFTWTAAVWLAWGLSDIAKDGEG